MHCTLVVHCIVLYKHSHNTRLYSTVQYSTVQYSTVQYSTVHNTTLGWILTPRSHLFRSSLSWHSHKVCRDILTKFVLTFSQSLSWHSYKVCCDILIKFVMTFSQRLSWHSHKVCHDILTIFCLWRHSHFDIVTMLDSVILSMVIDVLDSAIYLVCGGMLTCSEKLLRGRRCCNKHEQEEQDGQGELVVSLDNVYNELRNEILLSVETIFFSPS